LAVLFVGVAGALWDATPLGDVVMATHVYAYHGVAVVLEKNRANMAE
jgi:nucleoside phosphorylase